MDWLGRRWALACTWTTSSYGNLWYSWTLTPVLVGEWTHFISVHEIWWGSIKRFEIILKYPQLSENENQEQHVLEFVAAVNDQFQKALAPGSYITLNESMIRSFHRNLHGKVKIIWKPRPVGNEIKNFADAASQVVLNLKLCEGKEPMSTKEFVNKPFVGNNSNHYQIEIGIYEIVPKILTPTPTDSWDIVSRMRQILSCMGQFFYHLTCLHIVFEWISV